MKVIRKNKDHRYAKSFLNTSIRHLYIQLDHGDKVLVETKSYLVSFNDLVSSIGGGLGLFLGFSMLSTFTKVLDQLHF